MTTSRGIGQPPARSSDLEAPAAPAELRAAPNTSPRGSRARVVYLIKVLIATVIEAGGLYLWLRLYESGELWWGLLFLVLGETVETLLFHSGTTRDARARWGPLAPASAAVKHFTRVQQRVRAMGIAEIAIWLLWLFVAEEAGHGEAAVVLLLLMHLKHHVEVVTVRDVRFRTGLFTFHGTFASALEVGGAVACLALIEDGQFVLAAIVLGAGILLEHAIQIDVLEWEMKARDIRLPRDHRWKPPPRRRPVLFYLFTHFAGFWRLVERIKPLQRRFNRLAINGLISVVEPRPNVLSTMAAYTSWPSLTDRTYSGRHLPPVAATQTRPATTADGPPTAADAASLFERRDGMIECEKSSTVLFGFFAQWFTDGFLRSARNGPQGTLRDTQRNQSTHEIDLSQLYGLTMSATRQLRAPPDERDRVTGRPCRGVLKHQIINGEEYPRFYCKNGKRQEEFKRLLKPVGFKGILPEQRERLFAVGTDITNIGALACNVLFLREHNRIARHLAYQYPGWDDDRVFETARNVLTVVLLKIAVEEYVNHITPNRLEFRADPSCFTNEPWQRPNWMAIEFNLLYRWHSLVPATFDLSGRRHRLQDTLWDTRLLTDAGLGPFMAAASCQPAGRIGLRNTDPFLVSRAEVPSIMQGRAARLGSYNDYRRLCGLLPAAGFEDVSSDPEIQRDLSKVYRTVEDIEFYVGLFAEDTLRNGVLPELMAAMVAFDAFSQALNNPLLSSRIYNDETFSRAGREIIDATTSLSDLVERNTPGSVGEYVVSFTRPGPTA